MVALLGVLLALAAAPATEETKLGTGVSLQAATPIKALVAKPETFVGKTIRIDGIATGVCSHMA